MRIFEKSRQRWSMVGAASFCAMLTAGLFLSTWVFDSIWYGFIGLVALGLTAVTVFGTLVNWMTDITLDPEGLTHRTKAFGTRRFRWDELTIWNGPQQGLVLYSPARGKLVEIPTHLATDEVRSYLKERMRDEVALRVDPAERLGS